MAQPISVGMPRPPRIPNHVRVLVLELHEPVLLQIRDVVEVRSGGFL